MSVMRQSQIYIGERSENFFFNEDNDFADPQVLRSFGRVFLGAVADHSATRDGTVTGGSWLQGFTSPGLIGVVTDLDYLEDWARLAVVNDIEGGIAISGASRTGGGNNALGVTSVVINDGAGWTAHGLYADAVMSNVGARATLGAEINAANLVGPVATPSPYQEPELGIVNVLRLGVGSDASIFGHSYNVGAFIHLVNNGGRADRGIVVEHNAVSRLGQANVPDAPDGSGRGVFLDLPHNLSLSWRAQLSSGNPGEQQEVAYITSSITTMDTQWRMEFQNTGFVIGEGNDPDQNNFVIQHVANSATGLRVRPGELGEPTWLEALGFNDSVHLILSGQGDNGRVGFGEITAQADAAIVGHIEIVDAAGTPAKLALVA